jgi:Cu+-exporting ATPase
LPWAIELARAAVRTIRWNLFWAFAYNLVGVSLAFFGWLNPVLAACAMTASSILVVANSLRLGRRVVTVSTESATAIVEPESPAKHWSIP